VRLENIEGIQAWDRRRPEFFDLLNLIRDGTGKRLSGSST
jgi:hypothetical protein